MAYLARVARRPAPLVISLLILAYIGWFGFLSILRYETFFASSGDLAVYDQATWNTLQGKPFVFTSWGGELSHLGIHVDFTPFFLAPLYLIYADPKTLLVVQAVVVALGALPAFWLARDALRSELAGLAFVATYLLHPGTQGATLFEYHGVTLTASLLLFALYFLKKRRPIPFLLLAILAMSTKENIPLIVVAMGLYQMAVQRELRWGLTTTGLGALWFWAALEVVMPRFNVEGASPHWYLYQSWGPGPLAMLANMISNPGPALEVLLMPDRLNYLWDMLAPLGFLSPLGLPTFLISTPSWGVNLLSAAGEMHTMGIRQYHAELVPVLVASAVSGVGLLVAAGERLRPGWGRPILYLLLLWLAASTLVSQYRQGFTPLRPGFHLPPVTTYHQAAKEMMALVPPDATVAVSQELGPYLTRRQKLYYFLTESAAESDYLVIDIFRNRWGDHARELQQEVLRFIDQQNFGVVAAKDGVIFLRRNEPNKAMPEEFFSFAQANSPPAIPVSLRFGDEVEFLGLDIRPGSVLNDTADTVNIAGYWRLLKPASQDYVPALFFDTAGPVVGARGHPPGLVWYPVSQWRPGEIVKIDYPPPIWLVRLSREVDISVGVAQGHDEWAPAARLTPQLRLPEEAFTVVPGQNLVTVASVPQENRLPGAPGIKATSRRYSPPGSANPLSVDFQGELSLVGYDLDTAVMGPSAKLDFTLYWQAQKEMAEAYTVFVHLYDGEGRLRAQRDSEPVQGGYPTTAWRPGEVVADRRELSLEGLAPGKYSLEVGVYVRTTGRRLQAAKEGTPLPKGRAMVSKVSIPYP